MSTVLELRHRSLARRAVDPPGAAREQLLALHLPYITAVDDQVIMLRDGDVMASFEVEGIAAGTAESAIVDEAARALAASVAQARPNTAIYVHRISHEVRPTMPPVPGEVPGAGARFAARLDAAWQEYLGRAGLRARANMVSVVLRPTRLGGLWARLTGGGPRDLRAERAARVALLEEVIGDLMEAVTLARPRRLTLSSGRWLGLLAATLSGRYVALRPDTRFGPLADLLVDSRVDFRGDTFWRYGLDGEDMRVGALFSLKKYPTETWAGLLDRLDLAADMVVTQSFLPMDLIPALARVQRTSRQMHAADDAARSAQADLLEAADDLASGRIGFGAHHLTIMASARSEAELDALAADIRTQVQRAGGVAVREDIGVRAAYFAQAPGNFAYRARAAMISTACLADFAALHASHGGLAPGTEPWGAPLTILPTARGEPYRVNFHLGHAPGARTVGHTLVIGRTGSGKTLGTAFLLAQAQRVSPRIVVFDKDRGMEAAIRALGGVYAAVRMGAPTGFNPFRAEADARGAGWLTDWLAALLTLDGQGLSPVQSEALAQAVRSNMEADPALQSLAPFRAQLMSVDDEGDLHLRLGQWDRDGQYHWLFSGEGADPLGFDNPVTGFDLTEIFDLRAVRTAWLSYVFRRIERGVEDGRPTILVLDEAWKLLDDAYFQARLKDWMLTMRKKNVAVVMLTQRVGHITESRAGGSILESVATRILFPNAQGSAAEFAALGLSDREAGFLGAPPAGGRLALIRSGAGSAIVDFDLSALGSLLEELGGGERPRGADESDEEVLTEVAPSGLGGVKEGAGRDEGEEALAAGLHSSQGHAAGGAR